VLNSSLRTKNVCNMLNHTDSEDPGRQNDSITHLLACTMSDLFWSLFTIRGKTLVYLILKHRPVYFSKHNVSETGFCLRLHVKPTFRSGDRD
jgi:hypothetical protein